MPENTRETPDNISDRRVVAFLKLLRWAEGYPHEPNESNFKRIYGGGTMRDFNDHPRQMVHAWGKTASASGAYQITVETYDEFKKKLKLNDFSPESQTKITLAIITEKRALELIREGHISEAIKKLNGRWSSLPGGKHSRIKMPEALSKFDYYLLETAGPQVFYELPPFRFAQFAF